MDDVRGGAAKPVEVGGARSSAVEGRSGLAGAYVDLVKHVLYALFESRELADAAARAVADRRFQVELHQKLPEARELSSATSATSAALLSGAMLGHAAGALLGVLVWRTGYATSAGTTVVVSALLGLFIGLLGGGLRGSSVPDRALSRIARELRDGRVLLSIESEDLEAEEEAEGVLGQLGARVTHKPVV